VSIGRAILGLVAVGGAGLTFWKVAETVGETKVLGPPVWWVLWRHPLPADAPTSFTPEFGKFATRIYWFEKGKGWTAVTKHLQLNVQRKGLKSPPTRQSIYGQVTWKHEPKRKKWVVVAVEYGMSPNLPIQGGRP